jgi:hypothetical protein
MEKEKGPLSAALGGSSFLFSNLLMLDSTENATAAPKKGGRLREESTRSSPR